MALRFSLSGFIQPCLPTRAERPPSGPGWIHEIKHDGFRMMVRRDPAGIRLLTRNGHDWASRYPLIGPRTKLKWPAMPDVHSTSGYLLPAQASAPTVEAVNRLRARSSAPGRI
jgi:hypothetical protein